MGLIPKSPTRRQRLAAILAEIDAGDIKELPEEAESVSMIEDGRLLVGTRWITPADYQADEVASRQLPSLKGATPAELPSLDDDQAGDQAAHFARNDFPIS